MSKSSPRARTRKPVFDLVRQLLGRKFRQSEVDRLDAAIDDTIDQSAAEPGKANHPFKQTIGADGIALIKRFEGCARLRRDGLVEAYPDPGTGGDPWTIGWGATGRGIDRQERIGPGTVWTQAQCDARLA
ncbi:MAG: hypothetical protein AAGI28_05970, partial [Pseudomonadota bacterium]